MRGRFGGSDRCPRAATALTVAFVLSALACGAAPPPGDEAGAPPPADALERFVSAETAWALMGREATVLDARKEAAYRRGHLRGARLAWWESFSDASDSSLRGRLHPDPAELGRRLGAAGVRPDRPVLVYGDPATGWGEEGRIAWMLEAVGHPQVHLLDGGIAAWEAAGGTLTTEVPAPATGTYPVRPDPRTTATTEQLRSWMAEEGTVLLDTRSPEEFAGSAWYGVTRGGHLPGARSLPWQQLLDASGRLLPRERLRELVRTAAGAGPKTRIVAYCTGGIRSGFTCWALEHAGFADVRNYAGSCWEWSSRPELPLER